MKRLMLLAALLASAGLHAETVTVAAKRLHPVTKRKIRNRKISRPVGARKVFGTDDRVKITNTTQYPWSAVVKLWVTFPSGGVFHGSGAMIGPRHILTAGHVLYEPSEGGWATQVEVIPGLDGTYEPFGTTNGMLLRVRSEWFNTQDSNHDFGLITVAPPIGNSSGWFGYQEATDSILSTFPVLNIAGYPADKQDFGDPSEGLRMYYHWGNLAGFDAFRLFYQIDTYGGQSGSPIWRIDGSNRYIVGVHTGGDVLLGSNWGTRITNAKFNWIQSKINEDSAPVASNDSYSVNEDTPLNVTAPGVLANDTDPEFDPITATVLSGPAVGSLSVSANGSFLYTPLPNFNGTVTFTYFASDGVYSSGVTTVTITVNPVNDVPVASNGSGITDEDTPLSAFVPAASDVDGDPLTYIVDTGPAFGALAFNSNGSFTYTPGANFFGSDSFTFHANDGTADSNTVTYNITVNPVNDQPVAVITNAGSVFSGSAPFVLDLDGSLSADVEDGLPPIFLWDFGDGTTDPSANPAPHTYAAPGVYTVSLIVTDSVGWASNPVTVQVTVSGGAGDDDLYARRGLFIINWRAHNSGNDAADSFTLSGNFNLNGVPADLTGVSVRVEINGTQLGTSQTLDFAGRFASPRWDAPNYRYLLRSNRGSYSLRVSKTDLRPFIPGLNSAITESGQVLVEVRMLLSGGGLAAPVDLTNFLRFDYTTRANANTRGRFIYTRHDSLNGAFLSQRAIATEPRGGGGHVITVRGVIAPAGGGPLLPVDDPGTVGDVRLTLGTLVIDVPFAALNVRGLTPERSSYTYSRRLVDIPALRRFQINNARRSFILTTAVNDAGIPLSTNPAPASHVLSVQVDVMTASGLFTFTTQIELLRNPLRLKRWMR